MKPKLSLHKKYHVFMDNRRILVVDDEEALCEILKFNLEKEGFQTDVAYSAEEALTKPIESYSLLILDIMMGELSGTSLAKILKAKPQTASIPIIFCTARDGEDDTVTGLEIGADDYITKPFSIREVVARVKSVLRRSAVPPHTDSDTVSYEGLRLDTLRKTCTADGEIIPLTKKEFEILELLLRNPNVVFSREEILARIWHKEVIVLDRTIDVNITRLRKKTGRYGKHIITRQGYGYVFET